MDPHLSSNHEQALKTEISDHIKITRIPLRGADGYLLRFTLQRRHIYDLNYNTALRTGNLHHLIEREVSMMMRVIKEKKRPKICVTTAQTKTSHVNEYHYVECECNPVESHDLSNDRCPINVYRLFIQMKTMDFAVWIKNKTTFIKKGIKYEELSYFRRIRYVPARQKRLKGRKHKKYKGTYYSEQRLGERQLRDNFVFVCEEAKIDKPQTSNKRRTEWTSHSNRASKITHVEEVCGEDLGDTNKLFVSGHKHIQQWHGYAKKDGKSVAKDRTIAKVGLLMAQKIHDVSNEMDGPSHTSFTSDDVSKEMNETDDTDDFITTDNRITNQIPVQQLDPFHQHTDQLPVSPKPIQYQSHSQYPVQQLDPFHQHTDQTRMQQNYPPYPVYNPHPYAYPPAPHPYYNYFAYCGPPRHAPQPSYAPYFQPEPYVPIQNNRMYRPEYDNRIYRPEFDLARRQNANYANYAIHGMNHNVSDLTAINGQNANYAIHGQITPSNLPKFDIAFPLLPLKKPPSKRRKIAHSDIVNDVEMVKKDE